MSQRAYNYSFTVAKMPTTTKISTPQWERSVKYNHIWGSPAFFFQYSSLICLKLPLVLTSQLASYTNLTKWNLAQEKEEWMCGQKKGWELFVRPSLSYLNSHWYRLPRGVMESPSLKIFKSHLDTVLDNLLRVAQKSWILNNSLSFWLSTTMPAITFVPCLGLSLKLLWNKCCTSGNL